MRLLVFISHVCGAQHVPGIVGSLEAQSTLQGAVKTCHSTYSVPHRNRMRRLQCTMLALPQRFQWLTQHLLNDPSPNTFGPDRQTGNTMRKHNNNERLCKCRERNTHMVYTAWRVLQEGWI